MTRWPASWNPGGVKVGAPQYDFGDFGGFGGSEESGDFEAPDSVACWDGWGGGLGAFLATAGPCEEVAGVVTEECRSWVARPSEA